MEPQPTANDSGLKFIFETTSNLLTSWIKVKAEYPKKYRKSNEGPDFDGTIHTHMLDVVFIGQRNIKLFTPELPVFILYGHSLSKSL